MAEVKNNLMIHILRYTANDINGVLPGVKVNHFWILLCELPDNMLLDSQIEMNILYHLIFMNGYQEDIYYFTKAY